MNLREWNKHQPHEHLKIGTLLYQDHLNPDKMKTDVIVMLITGIETDYEYSRNKIKIYFCNTGFERYLATQVVNMYIHNQVWNFLE